MIELTLNKRDKVVVIYDASQKRILDFDMDSPDEMKYLAEVIDFVPERLVIELIRPNKEKTTITLCSPNIGRKVRFIAPGGAHG